MRSAASLLRRVRAPRRSRGFRPQLECLEDRLVMSTIIVDPTPGKGNYTTIGAAVTAANPGDTIDIDSGTYTEQVVVNKNLTLQTTPKQSTAIIAAPSTLTGSAAIVDFTGTAVTSATLKNLDIEGPGTGLKAGVNVEQGAGGVNITNDTLGNVHEKAALRNGIQMGIGVLVGGNSGGVFTAGSATISSCTISGYQKGGIVVENTGSTATITNNVVKGAGVNNAIAENGIEVGFGATANINNNSISNNIYGLASTTGFEAADILLYQPGAGTTVSNNSVTKSDVGIWALDASYGSISNNSVASFNFDGIVLDVVSTGCAHETVSQNSVNGGSTGTNAGIILFNASSCTVSNGAVSNCGEGIWLAGSDTSNTISGNAVSNSAADGIVVADFDNTKPNSIGTTSSSSGNTFNNNVASGSGIWDALDVSTGSGTAGTANTWKNNTFGKKNPGGLK
jgi:parallel beta-helix repeat protein